VTSIFDTCLPTICETNNLGMERKKKNPQGWTRQLVLFLLLCQQPLA
jgi:hypothetical protein